MQMLIVFFHFIMDFDEMRLHCTINTNSRIYLDLSKIYLENFIKVKISSQHHTAGTYASENF